jgi:membrane protease YdiL (CAAX protease family)
MEKGSLMHRNSMMKDKQAILYYWIGTIVQMSITCAIVFVLNSLHIKYGKIPALIFLACGGLSSAIWGCVISKKSGRVKHYRQIAADFFNYRQPVRFYLILIGFIVINFGKQIITGQINDNTKWYTFFIIFVESVLFGGVEEIGWRYTFQPKLEKHLSFELSSFITFASWAIWHYMYFYITGTVTQIDSITFLLSLLGSSFILGAIYHISQSLCLCVLYHVLLNVFSQTLATASVLQTIITVLISVILSITIVKAGKHDRQNI